MKICYVDKNFKTTTIAVIAKVNEIVTEYQAEGYELTLRQVYYQFVSRDCFPESWFDEKLRTYNTIKNYKKLGSAINDGRLAGLIDWKAVVDRTRQVKLWQNYEDPADAVAETARTYAIDTREGQEVYVEAWIEKEALAGVLRRASIETDIPYFACKGYVSQSAMWRAAQRIRRKLKHHDRCVILHLGDHDPSGIDMTRDIRDRLELFECDVEIDRIALNKDQVDKYNPPPNFAKITDSRVGPYIAEYGEKSWELDALEPRVITGLVESKVGALTDKKLRRQRVRLQEQQREKLNWLSDNFGDLETE